MEPFKKKSKTLLRVEQREKNLKEDIVLCVEQRTIINMLNNTLKKTDMIEAHRERLILMLENIGVNILSGLTRDDSVELARYLGCKKSNEFLSKNLEPCVEIELDADGNVKKNAKGYARKNDDKVKNKNKIHMGILAFLKVSSIKFKQVIYSHTVKASKTDIRVLNTLITGIKKEEEEVREIKNIKEKEEDSESDIMKKELRGVYHDIMDNPVTINNRKNGQY